MADPELTGEAANQAANEERIAAASAEYNAQTKAMLERLADASATEPGVPEEPPPAT